MSIKNALDHIPLSSIELFTESCSTPNNKLECATAIILAEQKLSAAQDLNPIASNAIAKSPVTLDIAVDIKTNLISQNILNTPKNIEKAQYKQLASELPSTNCQLYTQKLKQLQARASHEAVKTSELTFTQQLIYEINQATHLADHLSYLRWQILQAPNDKLAIYSIIANFFTQYTHIKNLLVIKDLIKDSHSLIEVVKLCAQKRGKEIAINIKKFEIKDEQSLVDIAKQCVLQSTDTIAFLKDFNIQNQKDLVDLAKLCAQQDGAKTARFIKDFDILNEEDLVEIAKLCTRQDVSSIIDFIQNFNIQNQKNLVDIIKIGAQQNEKEICSFIKHFHLQNEEDLVEIAKLCAEQNNNHVSKRIKNFNIQNKNHLLDIAMRCAQQNENKVAQFIKNFRFQDEKDLIDIAKQCAYQKGSRIAQYIQNFNIQNQESLFEICKISAQINGKKTAKFIEKFNIKDQNQLIEIAKLCAQQNGSGTAKHIKNFSIRDPKQLVEIVKLCAKENNPANANERNLINYLENFSIRDPHLLIDLIKICAKQNGENTARQIPLFNIQDPEILIEIAKICAQQDGSGTARFIKNFRINDQKILVEIAKICTQKQGNGVARFIKNFEIQDQKDLMDIAKLCAQEDGLKTMKYVKEFNIQAQQNKIEIFKLCIAQSQESLIYAAYVGAEFVHLSDLALYGDKHHDDEYTKQLLVKFFGEDIQKYLISSPMPIQFLINVFLTLKYYPEKKLMIEKNQFVEALLNYRAPSQRALFLPILENMPVDFVPSAIKEIASFEEKSPSYKLLRVLLTTLIGSDSKYVDISAFYKGKWLRYIRKGPNFILLNNCLLSLAKTDQLTSTGKQKIIKRLQKLSNPIEIKQQINAMQILLALKADKDLLKKYWIIQAEEHFKQIIPLGEIHNFSNSYGIHFLESRHPQAISLFAAKLQTLNDSSVMQALGDFITSVLNENFKQKRYQLDSNKHLKTIHERHPHLLEVWQKGKINKLDGLDLQVFDFNSWTKEKLIVSKHLPDLIIHQISAYLENEQALIANLHPLIVKIQNLLKETDKQQALKGIQEELQQMDPIPEFLNDIKDLLDQEINSTISCKKLVETDDPIDLLLCGTDVSGSCQKVDGDPDLNKGLLGYLLDGKIRLLAIKHPNGQIKSRCLLKLMWNNDQAVLFQERIYPPQPPLEDVKILHEQAKQKAKELGIPLVTVDKYSDDAVLGSKPLVSLGGPAPFEYSDAAEQEFVTNGSYKVSQYYLT